MIIDASAVVEAVQGGERGARVLGAVSESALFAPDILDAEVLQALKGLERGGRLTAADAALAVTRVLTSPIERCPSRDLGEDAWELRHNLSLYDAMYVALAGRRGSPLLTADAGMAGVAQARRIVVTLI